MRNIRDLKDGFKKNDGIRCRLSVNEKFGISDYGQSDRAQSDYGPCEHPLLLKHLSC